MRIDSDYGLLRIPVKERHHIVVYMDEFGQDGRKSGKFGVAMLFLPKPGVKLLGNLTKRVVLDVQARMPSVKKVKAEHWAEEHRLELCNLIRENAWPVGFDWRELSHPGWKAHDPNREKLFKVLEEAGDVVGFTPEDVEAVRKRRSLHHVYIDHRSASASRSSAMTWSGVCRLRFMTVLSGFKADLDSHSIWTSFRGADQLERS